MTSRRALVLGDPGPWLCAGMTGGVVYLKLNVKMGFDRDVIQRRVANGAKILIQETDAADHENLQDLLQKYWHELIESNQLEEANRIQALSVNIPGKFVKVRPSNQQVEQSVSTE